MALCAACMRGACQPAAGFCFPLEAMPAQIYLQPAEDSKYTHKDGSEDAQTQEWQSTSPSASRRYGSFHATIGAPVVEHAQERRQADDGWWNTWKEFAQYYSPYY